MLAEQAVAEALEVCGHPRRDGTGLDAPGERLLVHEDLHTGFVHGRPLGPEASIRFYIGGAFEDRTSRSRDQETAEGRREIR
ncbi:hypothetical protein GCM10025298_33620 [Natronobiforma cellulositropha]